MTHEEFAEYYPRYEPIIRAIARKIAQRNDSLIDDLVQEGFIALLDVEPSKAKDNPDAYIRQALKFRMIDWMRREKPARHESLSAMLEQGDQLVQDEDTSEPRILSAREQRRRVLFEDDESRAAFAIEHQDDGRDVEE